MCGKQCRLRSRSNCTPTALRASADRPPCLDSIDTRGGNQPRRKRRSHDDARNPRAVASGAKSSAPTDPDAWGRCPGLVLDRCTSWRRRIRAAGHRAANTPEIFGARFPPPPPLRLYYSPPLLFSAEPENRRARSARIMTAGKDPTDRNSRTRIYPFYPTQGVRRRGGRTGRSRRNRSVCWRWVRRPIARGGGASSTPASVLQPSPHARTPARPHARRGPTHPRPGPGGGKQESHHRPQQHADVSAQGCVHAAGWAGRLKGSARG